MADKIIIKSDGTVTGTKVTIDGNDLTSSYKVNSLYFHADGGNTYTSTSSGEKYVSSPTIGYSITYLDGDKVKSISVGNQRKNIEYGSLAEAKKESKDMLSYVGIEDKDNIVKKTIVENLDKMRAKLPTIPSKEVLEKRTIDSLVDKYEDCVIEIEEILKKEKKD